MPPRRPQAELIHRSPHRARLRLRLEDDEQLLLERIAREIAQLPQVSVVRASPISHSLLILHDGELEPILARADAWLELVSRPPRAPMRELRRAFEDANAKLSIEHGDALGSLTFFALLGAAAYQTARGKLLPAGMPLIGYALRVMEWAAEREPPPLPDS